MIFWVWCCSCLRSREHRRLSPTLPAARKWKAITTTGCLIKSDLKLEKNELHRNKETTVRKSGGKLARNPNRYDGSGYGPSETKPVRRYKRLHQRRRYALIDAPPVDCAPKPQRRRLCTMSSLPSTPTNASSSSFCSEMESLATCSRCYCSIFAFLYRQHLRCSQSKLFFHRIGQMSLEGDVWDVEGIQQG